MVELLKNIWEEFLGRFIDYILSFWLSLEERIRSENRLRKFCSVYAKELGIEEENL